MVSQPLGNSVGLHGEDRVGVVTPWEKPNALEGLTAATILEVQNAIDGKNYRQNSQAKDWIGHHIAPLIRLNAETDKPRINTIVNTWIASGALAVTIVTDEKGKEPTHHRSRRMGLPMTLPPHLEKCGAEGGGSGGNPEPTRPPAPSL